MLNHNCRRVLSPPLCCPLGRGKRIVKSPKLYFRDSGLLCWMLGLDARTLPSSPFIGAVWEGFVFAELRKLAAVDSARPHFWFYRDQASREIDLVIEVGGRSGGAGSTLAGFAESRTR